MSLPVIGQGVHFNFNGRTIAALIIDILTDIVDGKGNSAVILQTFDPKNESPERVTATQGDQHLQWNYRPAPVAEAPKVTPIITK